MLPYLVVYRSSTREHVLMLGDETVPLDIVDSEISFFNPREDEAKMEALDFIVSDVGRFVFTN